MGGINTIGKIRELPDRLGGFITKGTRALLFTGLLGFTSPANANTNYSVVDNNLPNIELEDSTDIIGDVERDTGIKFPASYRESFYDFVRNNSTIGGKHVKEYTKKFIINKLGEDWGIIDKSNQFLFICSAIVKNFTNEPLYKNLEEKDTKKMEDYKKTSVQIFKTRKEYRQGLPNHLDSISADFKANSGELSKDNAYKYEKNKKSLEEILIGLRDSYEAYKKNPDDKYLEELRTTAKRISPGFARYGVNWRDYLSTEAYRDLFEVKKD